jgi:hypothetical protein
MSQPRADPPQGPAELTGDPVYIPEPYPQADYGPTAGPAPAPRGDRVSEPVVGWLVAFIGLVIVLGALLPWASALGVSVPGTSSDGRITLVCGVIISIMGVLIGVGHGHLWTSATALAFALIVGLVALVDVAGGVTVVSYYHGFVAIESGLWLTLVAGLLCIGLSVVALVRRELAAPR